MASTIARTLTRSSSSSTLRLGLRRAALPLTLGLTTGLVAVHHQRPMRFDYSPPSRSLATGGAQQQSQSSERKDMLDAETVKELSGGSLSGNSFA